MDWLQQIDFTAAKKVLKKILDVEDSQELVAKEVSLNNRMLKVLMNAPYQQALLHLKDGELDKYKDKVIVAITQDPLNLRARILYVQLLNYFGSDDRAIEECFNLLEWLGLSQQLAVFLPAALMGIYSDYLREQRASIWPFYREQDATMSRRFYVPQTRSSQNGDTNIPL